MTSQQSRGHQGRPARAFRDFVLKIHSRCDLACDYCYMYTLADDSWRAQPFAMSRPTVSQTAGRIAEHVRAHKLASVNLILHGGEPLLAGPALIEHAVATTRARVDTHVALQVRIQTNAVRLRETHLELFSRLGVQVGVSLDGGQAAQDRHRRTRSGRGSFGQVDAALSLLTSPRYKHLFRGFLCTIDLRNDPLSTYHELLGYAPPAIDFLLPDGNWSNPPPSWTPESTHYADWLIPIFDEWYAAEPTPTRVRMFDDIISVLLGGGSRTEGIGLNPVCVAVVETDGSIQQSDLLKSAYPGAGATGLHVRTDEFDRALEHPSLAIRLAGLAGLAPECLACSLRTACGGGLYPHRYRAGSDFSNPSVYCADLYRLISHVRTTLTAHLARLRLSRP